MKRKLFYKTVGEEFRIYIVKLFTIENNFILFVCLCINNITIKYILLLYFKINIMVKLQYNR